MKHPIPDDPAESIHKEKCVWTKVQKAQTYLCAMLNLSFGDHFKITWASIAASTSWTQSHLYYSEPDRERFWTEPGPTADLQNPLEAAAKERWERYLKE